MKSNLDRAAGLMHPILHWEGGGQGTPIFGDQLLCQTVGIRRGGGGGGGEVPWGQTRLGSHQFQGNRISLTFSLEEKNL